MDMERRMRETEAAFLAIVEDAGLAQPDGVEHDGDELVFRWDESKLLVVVDCSEGAAKPALSGGIGGVGQA